MGPPGRQSCLAFLAMVPMALRAEAEEDSSVFALGDELNHLRYALVFTITVGALILINAAVNAVERYFKVTKQSFMLQLQEQVNKELMLLGLVSFVLFILEQAAVIPHGDTLELFEFSHVLVFFMGIIFVIVAIFLGAVSTPIKIMWQKGAYLTLPELQGGLKAARERSWWTYLRHPGLMKTDRVAYLVAEYHLYRCAFTHKHASEADVPDFPKYVRRCMDRVILSMVNIEWRSWMWFIVALLITVGLESVVSEEGVEKPTAMVFALMVLGLDFIAMSYLLFKRRGVMDRLGVGHCGKDLGSVLQSIWLEPVHYLYDRTRKVDGTTQTVPERTIGLRGAEEALAGKPRGSLPGEGDAANGSEAFRRGSEVSRRGSEVSRRGSVGSDVALVEEETLHMAKRDADVGEAGGGFTVVREDGFKMLQDACTLLKCFYVAFYFSYLLGRSMTGDDDAMTTLWCVVLILPTVAGIFSIWRRLVPHITLMSTLKQVNVEVIEEIREETAEIERARVIVLEKMQAAMQTAYAADPADQASSPLSPRSRAIDYWFNRWDIDGNHHITRGELRKGLANLNISMSRRELAELMHLADPDATGGINLQEFKGFLYDLSVCEGDAEHLTRVIAERVEQGQNDDLESKQLLMDEAEEVALRAPKIKKHHRGPRSHFSGTHFLGAVSPRLSPPTLPGLPQLQPAQPGFPVTEEIIVDATEHKELGREEQGNREAPNGRGVVLDVQASVAEGAV